MVLLLILVSLPFYWISFEIPKRIVNDAIQGRAFRNGAQTAAFLSFDWSAPSWLGGFHLLSFPGISLAQVPYLFSLSLLFLALTLVNGWFKFSINTRKGILGERMLRRLRFDLFAQLLRFTPEDIRAVKASEVASMIKDEVDPIGGFIGDAFIQPAFLGTQATTALIFIITQNFLMGAVALAIVLAQAVVIPRLRIEQLRLGRLRQLASRELAGQIGEIVDGAATLHVHGAGPYANAEIGSRLGRLFDIRVDLFKRKFAVKYLNNLLATITPFFFYAIGGYFALKGRLDIGQLVAVIAAYRDLPPPIKELIDWDQQRNDVTLKYEQVVMQFTPGRMMVPIEQVSEDFQPQEAGTIAVKGVKVVGGRGVVLLERLSVKIEPGMHVALTGLGSGREILPKLLARQITEYEGEVRIGARDLSAFSDAEASRVIAYAGHEPHLFSGTIRENILFALRRNPPVQLDDQALSIEDRQWMEEARLTANPLARPDGDWLDYAAAGLDGPENLDVAVLDVLDVVGAREDIFNLGIYGRLGTSADAEIRGRFVEARRVVRDRLAASNMNRLVEPFDPLKYHHSSSIGQNLLFGVALGESLKPGNLANDPYVLTILRSEALMAPVIRIGLSMARWSIEAFQHMRFGQTLAERYAFVQPEDVEAFTAIIEIADTRDGLMRLSELQRQQLATLGLLYVEPQHRLGLIDDALRARVLRARASYKRFLPAEYDKSIDFYAPDHFIASAPVLDNLLFGRISSGVGNAERKVWQLMRAALAESGLEIVIYRLGLETEVGQRGRLATPQMRAAIELARCLIRKPQILIIDGALAPLGTDPGQSLARIRKAMQGRTVIATVADSDQDFDQIIAFDGARGSEQAPEAARSAA